MINLRSSSSETSISLVVGRARRLYGSGTEMTAMRTSGERTNDVHKGDKSRVKSWEWVVEQPSGSENSTPKIMAEGVASCAKEEVHLPPQEEYFQSDKHADSSLRKMECFFQNKTLTDVVLVAGTRKIQAHRLVLSSASDYFAAMFTSNVREANQQEIVLKDVDPASLEDLVKYCYTGHIELREDNVETLLATSCLLQLNEVVEACCRFLLKQLHPSNCIGIRLYAESHGCHELQKSAQKFTADHFMDVIQNQEFLLLPADEIQKLLLWEDINVPSEEKMFEALLAWLKYDLDPRKCELPRLLSHVKLPLLSPQFIADNLESYEFLQDDRTTQSLILEALKYHLLPERRFALQNQRTKPRKSTVGFLYAVGGMDSNKGATSIEKYDLRTNTWSQIANMNHRRLQFGVAVLDGKLFVVGGRDGLKTLNTVESYDPQTQMWTTQSPMSTHRHGLGVGVLGGPLYAVGGHDGWSYLNTVERWDPAVRQWCYVAPMTTQRSTVGVAVMNDKLFAVGGRDGSSCLRTVECYDPHTNKWILCAPMNKRRGGVGVGVARDYLFAFGGHDSPASNPCSSRFDCVERYDLTTDTWTVVTSMSIGRDAVGISLLGDRLFATGGYDGQQYLDLVEAYDPQANEWEKMASLNVGRAGACAVVVRNNLA